MSWQFDKPLIGISNGTRYPIAVCTSTSDFSNTNYFRPILYSVCYYSPLGAGSSAPYTSGLKKITDSGSYFVHLNRCKVSVTYTRTASSPTSGVTNYTWVISKIEFEMPLPASTSGTLTVAANTKTKTGTLKTITQRNSSSTTFSLSCNFNGAYVSGSVSLTSSGTVSFYLS